MLPNSQYKNERIKVPKKMKSINPGPAKQCMLAKISDVKMNTRKILLRFCERAVKI